VRQRVAEQRVDFGDEAAIASPLPEGGLFALLVQTIAAQHQTGVLRVPAVKTPEEWDAQAQRAQAEMPTHRPTTKPRTGGETLHFGGEEA
jgi:hypothetical protein